MSNILKYTIFIFSLSSCHLIKDVHVNIPHICPCALYISCRDNQYLISCNVRVRELCKSEIILKTRALDKIWKSEVIINKWEHDYDESWLSIQMLADRNSRTKLCQYFSKIHKYIIMDCFCLELNSETNIGGRYYAKY